MKLEKQHIESIRKRFSEMETKDDFVALLNIANKIRLYGIPKSIPFDNIFNDKQWIPFSKEALSYITKTKNYKPISLSSITYYANPKLCKKRYTQFSIRKKTGGERIINSPVRGLKSILRALNFVLQCIYEPHKAVTGFVLEKSVVDNAKTHVGNRYVYNIDIKDFFHSFEKKNVKYGFMTEPFSLGKKREELAFLIANLCTHPMKINGEIKNVLPQGSPTSPTITNILCKRLDRRLTGFAKRFGLRYSRYADDISFSSPHNIYKSEEFLTELDKIIKNENLVLNSKKTRLQKEEYRQEVTGLVVNEKVNVKRRYIKQIRMWLYYWEQYGYGKAEQIFTGDYYKDKGHVKTGKPNLANVLDGKLEYLKMVKGDSDSTYLKLKDRFDSLYGYDAALNNILKIWEKQGIDYAIKEFEKLKGANYNIIFFKKSSTSIKSKHVVKKLSTVNFKEKGKFTPFTPGSFLSGPPNKAKTTSNNLEFVKTYTFSDFENKFNCKIEIDNTKEIKISPPQSINIPLKIDLNIDILKNDILNDINISLCRNNNNNNNNNEFWLIHKKISIKTLATF